jgi:chromosome segregation ATPase
MLEKGIITVHRPICTVKKLKSNMMPPSPCSEGDSAFDGRNKNLHSSRKRRRSESRQRNGTSPHPASPKVSRTDNPEYRRQKDSVLAGLDWQLKIMERTAQDVENLLNSEDFTREQVTEIRNLVDNTAERLTCLQNSHADELSAHGNQIAEFQERISEACEKVDKTEKSMNDVAEISRSLEGKLNSELDGSKTRQVEWGDKLSTVEKEVASMVIPRNKMVELEQKVVDLRCQKTDLEKKLNDVQAQRDLDRVEQNRLKHVFEQRLANIQGQRNSDREKQDRRIDELSGLVRENSDVKKRVEDLERIQRLTIQALKKSATETPAMIDGLIAEISTLRNSCERVQKSQTIIENRVELLVANGQTVESNLRVFDGRVHTLETKQKDSHAKLQHLTTSVHSIQSEQKNSKDSLQVLTTSMDSLHSEQKDSANELHILTTSVGALQGEQKTTQGRLNIIGSAMQKEQKTTHNALRVITENVSIVQGGQETINGKLGTLVPIVDTLQMERDSTKEKLRYLAENVESLQEEQESTDLALHTLALKHDLDTLRQIVKDAAAKTVTDQNMHEQTMRQHFKYCMDELIKDCSERLENMNRDIEKYAKQEFCVSNHGT